MVDSQFDYGYDDDDAFLFGSMDGQSLKPDVSRRMIQYRMNHHHHQKMNNDKDRTMNNNNSKGIHIGRGTSMNSSKRSNMNAINDDEASSSPFYSHGADAGDVEDDDNDAGGGGVVGGAKFLPPHLMTNRSDFSLYKHGKKVSIQKKMKDIL